MQIKVNEQLVAELKEYNIFQVRTGMASPPDPVYQRRWKVGDVIEFSEHALIEEFVTFAAGNTICSSGAFSSLASSLPIGSKVGRYVSIAAGLKKFGFRHPVEAVCMNSAVFNFSRENIFPYFNNYEKCTPLNKNKVPIPQPHNAPITIGHDVWIGENVTMVGGISIGDGAVVASNSIVTSDVPPYTIAAGIPAKPRKLRFHEDIVKGLQEIQWWNYELGDLFREHLDFSVPEKFIEDFHKKRKDLGVFSPKVFSPFLYANFGASSPIPMNQIVTEHKKSVFIKKDSNVLIQSCSHQKNDGLVPVQVIDSALAVFIPNLAFLSIDKDSNILLSTQKNENTARLIEFKDEYFFVKCGALNLSAIPNGEFRLSSNELAWERFRIGSFFNKKYLGA